MLTLTGSGRQKHFAGIADHDLLLTSYALLTRDIAVLREQPLHLLILDEAQHIKNPPARPPRRCASCEPGNGCA